jgi:CubicO group peptidase (beta-lactamase class C family)
METAMKEKMEAFLKQTVEQHQLPGLAAGIVKDSQAFEAGFGSISISCSRPITPGTLFHCASISKLFSATAVIQLAENGHILLDDPLVKHLPWFRLADSRYEAITIRQLLSHTSGLSDITDYGWDQPEYDTQALERYVRGLSSQELLAAPGERFAYSNIGYEVLGALIAGVSGMPFEDYIKKHILLPPGMKHSTHLKAEIPDGAFAEPHLRGLSTELSPLYPYHRSHAPSSTLHSNAREMNLWMSAMLQNGLTQKAVILQPESHTRMREPQAAVLKAGSPGTGIVQEIGLGWFLGEHRENKTLSHSGQDIGFTSQLVLIPEKGLGVIVLCNSAPAPVRAVVLGVLDILLGLDAQYILPSIMIPLGEAYAAASNPVESGLQAVRTRFIELQGSDPDGYDTSPERFLEVCGSLLDAGRNRDALNLLTFTLELHPQNAAAWEMLARAHFQNGDMAQAGKAAMRSLDLEPDNPFLLQQTLGLQGT